MKGIYVNYLTSISGDSCRAQIRPSGDIVIDQIKEIIIIKQFLFFSDMILSQIMDEAATAADGTAEGALLGAAVGDAVGDTELTTVGAMEGIVVG